MKQIQVLTFGVIVDITGKRNFMMNDIDSTEALVKILEEQYPLLKTLQYAIAVDKEVIQQHKSLNNNSIVAILPPFSGG